MSTAWICRAYRPGDEAGIIELYGEVFHLRMSPELWRWMYQLPPAGPAVIAVLESDDRLVGHYGVQPREFWISGHRTTLGFAVGTMVHPQLRSVKALVEMAQLAYAICRERKFPYLYAFPNDAAHKVRCALLGWTALPQIVEWDGPMPQANDDSSDAVQRWRHFPGELSFDELLSHEEGISRAAPNPIRSARSGDFLRWRFFDRPGSEYVLHTIADDSHVSGYAVVKRYVQDGIKYGHILDWRVSRRGQDRSTELFASLWKQFKQWEVERISCWARSAYLLEQELAEAGLAKTGRKSNFCYFDLQGSHAAELSQESAWQFEMADSDVY